MRHLKSSILSLFFIFTVFGISPAVAWDAGSDKCKHNSCSNGYLKSTITEINTRYGKSKQGAKGWNATCPSGYTNIGPAGCARAPKSISAPSKVAWCPKGYRNIGLLCQNKKKLQFWDTKGPGSMTCPSGYFKSKILKGMLSVRCHKNCSAGYRNTGEHCMRSASTKGPSSFKCGGNSRRGSGVFAHKCFPRSGQCLAGREAKSVAGITRCFPKCPAGSERAGLTRCIHKVTWRGNTHHFIVHQALRLLTKMTDPVAKRVVAVMKSQTCRKQWELGLWDVDDKPELTDSPEKPSGAGGSHFYNGGGKDAHGKSTTTVTYKIAGVEAKKAGNARQNAAMRIANAKNIGKTVSPDQCYQLGLALHYMTDMTQPMHATSFSGMDSPFMLHPVLEFYTPLIQEKYPARGVWNRRWLGKSADDVFHLVSVRSGTFSPSLMKAINASRKRCLFNLDAIAYAGPCFLGNPSVNSALKHVLNNAYHSTASYLHAVFKPHVVNTPNTQTASLKVAYRRFPGKANDVSIGRGRVWIIGTDKEAGGFAIFKYGGPRTKAYGRWQKVTGSAVRIAVDPKGVAWVVNKNHLIFRYTGSKWLRVPGGATDIAIGGNGKVWIIGSNKEPGGYGIYRWDGKWTKIKGSAVSIAVGPQGHAWITNKDHKIFRYDGNKWHLMPGRARDIGIGAKGHVWILGLNKVSGGYGVWGWTGRKWRSVAGGLTSIAVNKNGKAWGVNSNKTIYYMQ